MLTCRPPHVSYIDLGCKHTVVGADFVGPERIESPYFGRDDQPTMPALRSNSFPISRIFLCPRIRFNKQNVRSHWRAYAESAVERQSPLPLDPIHFSAYGAAIIAQVYELPQYFRLCIQCIIVNGWVITSDSVFVWLTDWSDAIARGVFHRQWKRRVIPPGQGSKHQQRHSERRDAAALRRQSRPSKHHEITAW